MKFQENQDCIEACLECASSCNQCVVSCLHEDESEVGKLTDCMQLCLETAVACYAASEMMTLGSKLAQEYCTLCAEICERCAHVCDGHNFEQCRDCARASRRAARLCREMVTHSLAMH